MSETFNLSWTDFENDSSTTIRSLLSDTEFIDITLASHDEEQIKAHKVILCSASPVFKRIISSHPHQHPLLYLRNINIKTLKSIIGFIYMGQTEVEQADLETFLNVSKELEIKGLSSEINPKQSLVKINSDDANTRDGYADSEIEDIFQEANREHKVDDTEIKQSKFMFTHDEGNSEGNTERDDRFQEVDDKATVESSSYDTFETTMPSAFSISESIGKYECYNCDYKANSSKALKLHKDAIHKGV